MTGPRELIERQKKAFLAEKWANGDILPYADRRDGTFGQYASNYFLIRLEPFVRTLAGKSGVTVCDGRGVEASYLRQMGLKVTATDLCPKRHALNAFAGEWKEENAEDLSFADEMFDWGLVKAGLHHLPRPMVGFYELLRVVKDGVMILEAHDGVLLRFVRKVMSGARDWEPSGNYVYRFRRREVEKACLSLALPGLASATRLLPWKRSHESIAKGSLAYALRHAWYGALNVPLNCYGNQFCVVVFKRQPTAEQIRNLRRAGLTYVALPRNPYDRNERPGGLH